MNLLRDQAAVWTGARDLRSWDLQWLGPLALGTGILIANDRYTRHVVDVSLDNQRRFRKASDYGLYAYAGIGAGMYFAGRAKKDEHLRETGFLAGEAALNSLAVGEVLKVATGRRRPREDESGPYFQGGNSFPSQHAMVSWSIATVFAKEYPGPLTKVLAYGGAGAISMSRVFAKEHFGADVLVGSALGYYIGHKVYSAHHNPELPGESIGTFVDSEEPSLVRYASTYVPVDSWVYEAFDRLAAQGYAPSAMLSLRPWTRVECIRLLEEVSERIDRQEAPAEVERTYELLRSEFMEEAPRNPNVPKARVREIYTRAMQITGQPLTDEYHFARTIVNDYGRPYGRGFNNITGATGELIWGPVGLYVTGEFQRASAEPRVSDSAVAAIASVDNLPQRPSDPRATTRGRLIEAYVALNVADWQLSFGKQTRWWNPSPWNAFIFSNNAEPLTSLRLTRTTTSRMPGVLGLLGPSRGELFIGRLGGYHFVRGPYPTFNLIGSWDTTLDPQPYVWGSKVSFHPTENLEFGFSYSATVGGVGRPLTLDTIKHSFSSSGDEQAVEPGDRKSGFDFRYRVPGLRKWLTIYNDSMAEDEPSPVAYPRRSSQNPGIYIPQIPKIPKLDFRAEGSYTDLPGLRKTGYYYVTRHYANGFTNFGNIIGSWIGRQGSGFQAWSTYSISDVRKIGVGVRRQVNNADFLGGGNLTDIMVRARWRVQDRLDVNVVVGYETWRFPVLAPERQRNVVSSIELRYRPAKLMGK